MVERAEIAEVLVQRHCYTYDVYVQAQGSDIRIIDGADPRPPAEVRAAWLAAARLNVERGTRLYRVGMLANMRNGALSKRVEDGLVEVGIKDVEAAPEEHATEAEQLCLSGREDGSGYVSVCAALVVGIACSGVSPV